MKTPRTHAETCGSSQADGVPRYSKATNISALPSRYEVEYRHSEPAIVESPCRGEPARNTHTSADGQTSVNRCDRSSKPAEAPTTNDYCDGWYQTGASDVSDINETPRPESIAAAANNTRGVLRNSASNLSINTVATALAVDVDCSDGRPVRESRKCKSAKIIGRNRRNGEQSVRPALHYSYLKSLYSTSFSHEITIGQFLSKIRALDTEFKK